MGSEKRICVVGSVNTDLHASVRDFVLPGQTIRAESFADSGGGKGANQAVAAAKLGARVLFVAKVGDDAFGKARLADFRGLGMDLSRVGVEAGCPSGVALIETDRTGQNRIVIIEGANGKVDPAFIEAAGADIASSSMALFQLELPMDSVLAGLRIARSGGAATMLDPAPAAPLPPEIFSLVDYITPNETETEALVGIRPVDDERARRAAAALLERGVRRAVIKAGSLGAWIFSRGEGGAISGMHCPVFPVKVVDTTAAGDSFNAGLAAVISSGGSDGEALRFACAVGALATTRRGAQEAVPSREEVEGLMAANPQVAVRKL
jgi:ribokinase